MKTSDLIKVNKSLHSFSSSLAYSDDYAGFVFDTPVFPCDVLHALLHLFLGVLYFCEVKECSDSRYRVFISVQVDNIDDFQENIDKYLAL